VRFRAAASPTPAICAALAGFLLSAARPLAAPAPAPPTAVSGPRLPVRAAAPDSAAPRPGEEAYRLSADRLEGSAGAGQNVYTATGVTVVHGATTVTGDSAVVYREREVVVILGNVRILDGATRMWGERASYDRKSRTATLRGKVRIEEAGSTITGEEAIFYRAENRSVITGHPVLRDSARTLKADRIEYDRNRDLVTATGHVDAYDAAESTRVVADRVRYDRRADYAWAEPEPVLTLEETGGKVTEVKALLLEFDNAHRRVYAIGDVRIRREELRAVSDRAEFYQSENRALLLGSPRAWDDQGTLSGDTLEIRFAGGQVESIHMHPNAVVEYAAKADSGRGERNVAHGDSVALHFEDEEPRDAVIIGHAESRYWPSSADSASGGRNVSNGDTIVVYFDGGKPSRATVRGGSRGIYYLGAEGDTSGLAASEAVSYKGLEIVYDVEHGLVDVLGNADVKYKEMQLKAGKVTFDSETKRMRAEDAPVLNDGKDKIVGTTMTYDLNSRQGTIYEGRTTYDRGFIYGEQVRRVSENTFYVKHGTYSTCDLRETHYHFESAKMRVQLQDKVVARPVILYIQNVPVLALPFYVFPIKPGRHSGFQLPQLEFGSATGGGKFVRNVGYYWAINDFMDASAWGDWYQGSSWVAHGQFRYNKRYGYTGQIAGSYQDQFGSSSNRWDLFVRHYQTLARNYALTAQVNYVNSSTYLSDVDLGHSVFLRVQRNLRSNLSLQRGWNGGAFSLGVLQNEDLYPDPGDLQSQWQVPSVSYSLNARPIGRPARGKEAGNLSWLSSTTYSFRVNGLYQSNTYNDALADTTGALVDTTDARGAARYDLALNDVRKVFGFLRVSPAISYNGVYYSRDASGALNRLGGVWRAGIGANTSLFGTFRTSLGPLRAIRHVITPAAALVYQPANTRLVYTYTDTSGVSSIRSRFVGVSGITLAGGEAKLVTFSLKNDLHVKWGDPAQPKVLNNLIQVESFGSYNILAARSGAKPLSNITTALHLQPIPRSGFDFSFLNDPYDDFRLLYFAASTGIALQGQSRDEYGQGPPPEEIPGEEAVREQSPLTPLLAAPSGLPWTFAASFGYTGSRSPAPTGGYTTWTSTARLNGSVGLNATKNWRFDYSWQFDLKRGEMVSQFFTVKRELHCWEMQFTRSISGDVSSEYYFKINVKNLPELYYEQGSRGLRGFGGYGPLQTL